MAGCSRFVASLVMVLTAATLTGCDGAASSNRTGAPSVSSASPRPGASALDGCLPPGEGRQFELEVEGRRIVGAVLGDGPRAVVLSNQIDGSLCGWLPEGRRLAQRGYRVVLWDQDVVDWASTISAVVADQRRRGATKVVLMGASKGGWASAIASGTVQPPVDGLVSLSGPGSLRGKTVYQELSAYRGPVLVISTIRDGLSAETLRTFPKAHTKGPTTVLSLEGGDHGWQLLGGEHAGRVRAAVDAFLATAL